MVKISKDEATWLRDNHRSQDVHMSSATHKAKGKRYYATTSPETLRLLKKYRTDHGYGDNSKPIKRR